MPNQPYKRLEDRAKEGKFDLVLPLDQMLVEKLPDEGETFAGMYPMGERVVSLRKQHFPKLSADAISARLRSLEAQGLVVSTKSVGTGGNKVWQRTELGKLVLLAGKGGTDAA